VPSGEDYFDDLSMHLVREIFKRGFELFQYDFDQNPCQNKMPTGEIDLAEVHAVGVTKLSRTLRVPPRKPRSCTCSAAPS